MGSVTFVSLGWLMAICSALMAGTYLAFSGFIMRALDSLDARRAINAMNAINRTILRSAFMPLFFGSSVIALLMALTGIWRWGEPGADLALTAGLVYGVGMFVITAFANVPLNRALAGRSSGEDDASQDWGRYRRNWTRWNTVRTGASLLTLILCIELVRY